MNPFMPFELAAVNHSQQYRKQAFNAALMAFGIEAALVLFLVFRFSLFVQSGQASRLIDQITLVDAVEQAREEPRKPEPVKEKTKAVPTVQKPAAKPVAAPMPVADNGLPMVEEKRDVTPPNTHATTTAAATSAAAPGAPSVNAEYIAKIRTAVQNAFVYPPAAIALGFHGKVKVRFHLSHKVPSGPTILTGSGMGLIDRAALQSVMSATYPEPPAELKNTDMDCEVWIEYRP